MVCLSSEPRLSEGHGKDAEETLAQLRKLPVSEADEARIDLAQADIASSVSDFRQEQLLSERAAGRGRAIGAKLLQAQALRLEANAWERMGQPQKSMELSQQARALFAAAGDRRGAALLCSAWETRFSIKATLWQPGSSLKRRFRCFGKSGLSEASAPPWSALGMCSTVKEICTRRKPTTNRPCASIRKSMIRQGWPATTGTWRILARGLGDLTGALKMNQQALAAFNGIGSRRGAAATLII